LQQRLGLASMHLFRSVYWADRVGEGPQYVRGQAAYGTVVSALGMRRAAVRAWARMEADPSLAEPTERTVAAYRRAIADYSANYGTDVSPFQIVMNQGQWMDIASYAEAVGGFILDALAQGRNQEAARWWTLAQQRLAMSAGDRTALYIVPPLLAAANGQPAEAVTQLRRIETEQAG